MISTTTAGKVFQFSGSNLVDTGIFLLKLLNLRRQNQKSIFIFLLILQKNETKYFFLLRWDENVPK